MRRVLKESLYQKIASHVGTCAAVLICAERAQSFAQSQQATQAAAPLTSQPAAPRDGGERIEFSRPGEGNGSTAGPAEPEVETKESRVPLSERYLEKFEVVKSKSQACELLEGRIVTYYDVASLVRGCKQHVIEDQELLNELVHHKGRKVVEVPARIYRLIPFGKPLAKSDLDVPGAGNRKLSASECAEIEKHYVTVSGMTYYYIESCKRRAFDSYYDLQAHNTRKSTIVTLTPETLYRIPEGPVLKVKSANEDAILMKMDGDVKWSLLARANRDGSLPTDTPESLRALQKPQKVNRDAVCRKLDGKVISFYSQIYFLEACRRRAVQGFSLTLQQRVEAKGGIVDMTPEEFRIIPAGKDMAESDVLQSLK